MNYKEGYDWGKQSLETAGVSEAELDARLLEDGLIHVRWNEKPLCSVDRDGIVRFRPADKVVRVLRGIFNAAVDNNLIAKSPVPAILRIGGKATQEDAHR